MGKPFSKKITSVQEFKDSFIEINKCGSLTKRSYISILLVHGIDFESEIKKYDNAWVPYLAITQCENLLKKHLTKIFTDTAAELNIKEFLVFDF